MTKKTTARIGILRSKKTMARMYQVVLDMMITSLVELMWERTCRRLLYGRFVSNPRLARYFLSADGLPSFFGQPHESSLPVTAGAAASPFSSTIQISRAHFQM